MFVIRMIFKIIALPVTAIVVAAGLLFKLFTHLSEYVTGPLMLFIAACDIYCLFMQRWSQCFLLTGMELICFLALFAQAAMIVLLEELRDGLIGFLRS